MNIIRIHLRTVKIFSLLTVILIIACNHQDTEKLPAFPGAEGFGATASGGRGGRVVFVDNLKDSGTGSLRDAIESGGKRIVVFRVSGTIDLKSPLIINDDDITIAGQTAPGDGICLRDYPVFIDADNVIIRYIRCRLGDKQKLEEDAISAIGQENLMIDHCSFSWGIDEVASLYDNENTTVQWCIISESLNHSYHHKGNHGYAGIWGGMKASFHHNLLAHNSSRNPRFQGSRNHHKPEKELVDFRNNVIYNWGINSSYGGESGNQNLIGNYYKYGPASKHKNRIVDPWDADGRWYVADNFVYGFPEISADNWAGGVQGDYWEFVKADSAFPVKEILTYNAETAYELVLADAGAVLPKRDALDQRIIKETRTGTATYGGVTGEGSGIIDTQDQVGGWPLLTSEPAPIDSDRDGMPDSWETEKGLNPSDPNDASRTIAGDGYTNLENYLNYLTLRKDFVLPPAEIQTEPVSASAIRLYWKENCINESGFEIERAEKNTNTISEKITVPANTTCYTDSSLKGNTTYIYRIRAFKNSVYSISSGRTVARTLGK